MLTLNKDKHSQPIGKGAGILSRVTIENSGNAIGLELCSAPGSDVACPPRWRAACAGRAAIPAP